DPRHLLQLAEIVDQGSLTRAARTLGVPQPTLSRAIMSLEARIGAPVLERGPAGVTPTEIGAILAREGRRIRDSLHEADLEHRQWKSGLEGRLRIGVGTLLAHSLMPRFLTHPLASDWNVSLKIEVEAADSLLERLKRQELDLAVTQIDPVFAPSGLRTTALFEETVGFYAGAAHALARRRKVAMADLSGCRFVSVGAFSRDMLEAFAEAGAAAPVSRLEFHGDVAMALHLLAAGGHVAAMPDVLMAHLSDGRAFVRLPVAWRSAPRVIAASTRQDKAGHPLIQAFEKRFAAFLGQVMRK
ncbi:MAG TPA: LysR family transcriptional regulator, partial [Beijerinckiaceae bacterium]